MDAKQLDDANGIRIYNEAILPFASSTLESPWKISALKEQVSKCVSDYGGKGIPWWAIRRIAEERKRSSGVELLAWALVEEFHKDPRGLSD